MPDKIITESRFNMWRAVFAMAHADEGISSEEETFMREALSTYSFSETQRTILGNDMRHKADIWELFQNVSEKQDRSDFFKYARLIVWCDGDFDEQEREIMSQLKGTHFRTLNEDEMKREIHIVFDEQEKKQMKERMVAIYKSLQNEQKSEGGYFGAVVRKMWADSSDR